MGIQFYNKQMVNNTQILNDLAWCFCGARESLEQVYNLSMQAKALDGDLVECGIASGSGIAAMKKACPEKMVWGYDSFEGIQLCGPKDTEQPGKSKIEHDVNVPKEDLLVTSGVTVCSREWVDTTLKGWGFNPDKDFTLIEGWVQETLPIIKPKKIALLRLDMDIYDPTYFALEELWPRIVKGGILIIDDANLVGVVRACDEFFHEIGYTPKWVKDSLNPMYLYK